jgi:hypothetical protein
MEGRGYIIFYQAGPDEEQIEVKLENESVWLNLNQIASLFDRDKSVISRHLKNIFEEKELDRDSVVAKNATTGTDGKTYQVEYFNLDVIISIGYRVKSKKGTQFRIWANQVLKEYLIKGYSIDKSRLQQNLRHLEELRQTVKLLGNVVESKVLNTEEATGLLKVITDYTYALDVLDQYDHQTLEIGATTRNELFQISYSEAMRAIKGLKDKFGDSTLFGNEKDESFQGSLAAIYQTFGEKTYIPVWKRRLPTCYTS